jgi:hypothetical protein
MKEKIRVMRHCLCLGFILGSVLLLKPAFLVPRVIAAGPPTFTVNSPTDVVDADPGDGKCETASGNGVCTLRAAIMGANHVSGATIYFGLPGVVTYTFTIPPSDTDDETTGDLGISNTMTIAGNGAAKTIIDGNATDRVLQVSKCIDNQYNQQAQTCAIGGTVVIISGVTIQNGKKDYTGTDPNAFAGGILQNGTLTLDHCVISNNSANASTGAAYGGGIYSGGTLTLNSCSIRGNKATVQSGSGIASGGGIVGGVTMMNSTVSGNMARDSGGGLSGGGTIINSTFSGNTAGNGGGLNGNAIVINSTFSGNDANANGSGIYHSGGTMGLYNVTIASNTANADATGFGFGGGIENASGTVSFQNTIISNNINVTLLSGHPLANPEDCSGTLTSNGYNIVSDTTDCTINGSFIQGDPSVGALQDNGGPTQTRSLLNGSAAINAGNPGGCTDNLGAILTIDQRGYTRLASGRCDIGAFESGGSLSHSLGNISTRAFVSTGNNVLIGGLIVSGGGPKKVILRALGPTLGQPPFNLPNSLQDPLLDLRDANGNAVATNDNWKDMQQIEIQASGYAPPNLSESAIVRPLAPGNYTAILSGRNSTTGNALVEAYRLN